MTSTKDIKTVKSPAKVVAGRVYGVSAKLLPRLDAKKKALLEVAARQPTDRRFFPELTDE
ncbi:MAG: hypothetical protein V4857_01640 [Pseudomonadota bacterium]